MLLLLVVIELDDFEREKIGEIYSEYYVLMLSVATRYIKDVDTAKEIPHNALTKIRKNLEKILSQKDNEKRSFIVNIMKSESIDYIRKENKRKKHIISLEEITTEMESEELSVEDYIIYEERRINIGNLMLKLSEQDIILLKAKYYHGCSTKELCELVGIESEATVRTKLFRATKKMHELVKESGIL